MISYILVSVLFATCLANDIRCPIGHLDTMPLINFQSIAGTWYRYGIIRENPQTENHCQRQELTLRSTNPVVFDGVNLGASQYHQTCVMNQKSQLTLIPDKVHQGNWERVWDGERKSTYIISTDYEQNALFADCYRDGYGQYHVGFGFYARNLTNGTLLNDYLNYLTARGYSVVNYTPIEHFLQ